MSRQRAKPLGKENIREIRVGVAVTLIDEWGRNVRDDSRDRPVITDASYAAGGR